MRTWVRALGVVLLMALCIPPAIQGHSGRRGHEFVGLFLQGEDYATASDACEEDPDLHTEPIWDFPSTRDVARLVGPGCEITFESVYVPHRAAFDTADFRGGPLGMGASEIEIEIRVDGALISSFRQEGNFGAMNDRPLEKHRRVEPGHRTIQLAWDRISGTMTRLFLDRLHIEPPDAPCFNAPITPPTIPSADGFGDGDYGWVGRAYRFTGIAAVDIEGDPLTYEWIWGDGTTLATPDLQDSHVFGTAEIFSVLLRATDDPHDRCPTAEPRQADSEPFEFRASDPWNVWITRVQPSYSTTASCVQGLSFTYGSARVVAGACRLEAKVSGSHGSGAHAARAEYRLDHRLWWERHDSPFSVDYESTSVPAGRHQLELCLYAANDRYLVPNCNLVYGYENVNPFDVGGVQSHEGDVMPLSSAAPVLGGVGGGSSDA